MKDIKDLLNAIRAEILKIKNSKIAWVPFIAFSLGPIMGGVFMIILSDPALAAQSSALQSKARFMSIDVSWTSYLGVLNQVIGIGGIMIFGFVISWIFGREYSDGTAKDLLALPVSRINILNAKFKVYVLWCLALAVSNWILGLLIAAILQLPGFDISILWANMQTYIITAILTITVVSPVAFFALSGKGYLAPLGFVALTLVFAQIIAATGQGSYFPWAIPGLYSNVAVHSRDQLNALSYLILVLTALAGYIAAILWWKYADHHK